MRKNALKKTVAVALAGTMVMGTFATAFAEETTTEAATEAAAEEEAAATDWEPFAENVTLTVPVYDRGVEGVPPVTDNYWTKWIQENFGDKYNVTVKFEPITRSDVMTSYSLLAASDTLPTILMEYDYPKVAQWSNDGYLTSFDMDAFKEVAPTYYARMEEQGQLDYTTMNGDTYFALAYRPYYNCGYTYQTFVRMDWLEQVGYDHVPATRAEYIDAMTKIQEAGISEHPAGGTMITGLGADQNYGYRTYPQDEEEWAMYGDVNIPALGWKPNYELLKRANEDYNLGFTNPEYYITDNETAKADFVNGTAYSFGGYISANMDFLTAFYENNPDGKLVVSPVGGEDPDNGTVPAWRADNPFGMIIGFSSSATEDELKAAWMYMEWMTQEENLFTMQWGIEGENFNYNEEGLPVSVGDYAGECKQGYNNSKDYWCVTVEARNAGTVEDMIAANSPQDLPQNFNDEILACYNARVEYAKEGYAVSDCLYSVIIDAESEYSQTLTEKYKEFRDELTMCSPDEFDALYEDLSQQYLDAGYQEVLDARKEAYEAGSSTKLPTYDAE